MLVVGMTGVPVAHISAVAKPATWGFFLFDLRQALAWYWWFPFFWLPDRSVVGFFALFDLNWKISAGLATSFAFAPMPSFFLVGQPMPHFFHWQVFCLRRTYFNNKNYCPL